MEITVSGHNVLVIDPDDDLPPQLGISEMPHVTFIHGIANKPPADELLQIWRRALTEAEEPIPLGDLGVTSSMVYWAEFLYEAPETDASAHEGVLENSAEAIDGAGNAPLPEARSAEEAAFIAGLRAQLTELSDEALAAGAPPQEPSDAQSTPDAQGTLERVPLPWFIKKRFMAAFLRDVHHYLFDVDYAPPGKPSIRIQQAIRQRFVGALNAAEVTRPHVVVAHSMGTVIAYDCLNPHCPGGIEVAAPIGLIHV